MIRVASLVAVACTAALLGSDLAAGKRAYEQGDYATALKELVPVADHGNAEALYLVGSMLFEGKGLTADKPKGTALFQFAADAGYALAELRLSAMYQSGDGVRKDTDTYLYWTRRAAEHGLPLAQLGMAISFWAGETGSKDRVQAYLWFSLCSASNDPFRGSGDLSRATIGNVCVVSRNALVEEMTKDQIAEAKKRTEDWKAHHSLDAPPKGK